MLAHLHHVGLHLHCNLLVVSHVVHEVFLEVVVLDRGIDKELVLQAGLLGHHVNHHRHLITLLVH